MNDILYIAFGEQLGCPTAGTTCDYLYDYWSLNSSLQWTNYEFHQISIFPNSTCPGSRSRTNFIYWSSTSVCFHGGLILTSNTTFEYYGDTYCTIAPPSPTPSATPLTSQSPTPISTSSTPTPPPTPTPSLSPNMTVEMITGIQISNISILVNESICNYFAINISNYLVILERNYCQSNNAILYCNITDGRMGSLQIDGNASVNGTFIITLPSDIDDLGTKFLLINASTLYSNISILLDNNHFKCKMVTATSQQDGNELFVLLHIQNTCNNDTTIIIGLMKSVFKLK